MEKQLYIVQGQHNPLKVGLDEYSEVAGRHLQLELALLEHIVENAYISKFFVEGLTTRDTGNWNKYLSLTGNSEERFAQAFGRKPGSEEDFQDLGILNSVRRFSKPPLGARFLCTERGDWRDCEKLVYEAAKTNLEIWRAIEAYGQNMFRGVGFYSVHDFAKICYEVRDHAIYKNIEREHTGKDAALLLISLDHDLRDFDFMSHRHNFRTFRIKVQDDEKGTLISGGLSGDLIRDFENFVDQVISNKGIYGKVRFKVTMTQEYRSKKSGS